MNNPNKFWIRLIIVLLVIIILVVIGRVLILPESWGEHGYYRGEYINQEAHKNIKYGTNQACIECHSEINELKKHSTHKNLSCEACHAPVAEHVKNGKKIAVMPVKQGEPQIELCLNCHQKIIGRPETFPMIDHKSHLEEQNVKLTHTCDQCHTVHAPLENINHVKRLRTLKERLDEK